MVFNSVPFVLFFIVIFAIYWFAFNGRTKLQNILLLAGSYFFYGYADWKMLPVLLVATAIFYFLGIWIERKNERQAEKSASALTDFGVLLGVGILLYFKYLGFFIDSFSKLFESFGLKTNWHSFNILMPVGISFFTFKLISYVVDIHRGKIQATKSFLDFATYISFFPCILSGPIDRPHSFLPQMQSERVFNYDFAVDGCRQVLWGLFKKVVIADTCAVFVDACWNNIGGYSWVMMLISIFVYMIQMYSDFSGYSDMAIGIGKLLGFKITPNFKYPLFALNMADYWRRWHISLTSWLTDYVFMPLNIKFRNMGNFGMILAVIINMIVVGFWHGANWTFGVFGLYHGLLFIPLILSGKFNKKSKWKVNSFGLPVLSDCLKMMLTVTLASIGLMIFRADNISQAIQYCSSMFNFSSGFQLDNEMTLLRAFAFTVIMLVVEWVNRANEHGLTLNIKSHCLKFAIYFALLFLIFVYGGNAEQFIYFQF